MSRKSKSASVDPAQSEAVEAVLAKATPHAADGAVAGTENMPAGGINDKIRHLIRLSKEQGYLTFDDINEALPESVENQEEIDNVLSILQNLEIEILEPDQVEDYKQRQEEAEEEESRTSQNDILDDPVRMYLKPSRPFSPKPLPTPRRGRSLALITCRPAASTTRFAI